MLFDDRSALLILFHLRSNRNFTPSLSLILFHFARLSFLTYLLIPFHAIPSGFCYKKFLIKTTLYIYRPQVTGSPNKSIKIMKQREL